MILGVFAVFDTLRTLAIPRAGVVALITAVMPLASYIVCEAADGSNQRSSSVSGVVLDETGAPVAGAGITLSMVGVSLAQASTGDDGRFTISNVPPGPFQLTVTAPGFASQKVTGVMSTGGHSDLPPIRLRLAVDAVTVDVTPSPVQVAEQQIKEQEKQRVLGVAPNFYMSFVPDAAPLNTRQKFQLSWKASIDPMEFAGAAGVAALQQRRHQFPAFGSGFDGYEKRFAAGYATEITQRLFSRVIMPSLFKQDPRYFYKGEGTVRSRAMYALSRSVIRKGDNGHWQPNYSTVVGSFAGAMVSNFYYPAQDRNGVGLTLENVGIGIGSAALDHLAEEFLWSRLTSRKRHTGASHQ